MCSSILDSMLIFFIQLTNVLLSQSHKWVISLQSRIHCAIVMEDIEDPHGLQQLSA